MPANNGQIVLDTAPKAGNITGKHTELIQRGKLCAIELVDEYGMGDVILLIRDFIDALEAAGKF